MVRYLTPLELESAHTEFYGVTRVVNRQTRMNTDDFAAASNFSAAFLRLKKEGDHVDTRSPSLR